MPFTRRQFVVGLSALSALGASIPFLPSALADATGEAVSGRRVFNLLINPEPPSLSSFNTNRGHQRHGQQQGAGGAAHV